MEKAHEKHMGHCVGTSTRVCPEDNTLQQLFANMMMHSIAINVHFVVE